ncbi:type IX secretion system membrane protein PorP/SprF [Flavobacteriaceae bacterium F08102]|nr:type IX secretion system membrane protein PorP/SprF [Flavobacteriaceae bacterium F08102]
MKNHKVHILMVIIFTFSYKLSVAQQQTQYTQYRFNTLSINSAYAGTTGGFEASIMHRSQWMGYAGAPVTQSLSLDGKLGESIGLGLNAFSDKIGPSNEVEIKGAFAYQLTLGTNTTLSLGINVGMEILNVDWSKGTYYDDSDVVFNENINELRPVFGAGGFLYGEQWYLGVSAPNLLTKNSYKPGEEVVFQRENHYYLMGGYVFNISDNLTFKPAILAKIVEGAPISADFSGNFMINEKITFGGAYRLDDSISGMLGLYLSKNLFIGYAYDFSISELTKHNDGSHEIVLQYARPNSNQAIETFRRFF